MIADTAMGIFQLAPHDPYWFRDPATVGRALDAVLDTPLGALVRYAGIIREAKRAPDRAAVHALVATGKDDMFALQEARRPERVSVALARSAVPPSVKRVEANGLVTLEWADSLHHKPTLDAACEAHEDWIDHHLPIA